MGHVDCAAVSELLTATVDISEESADSFAPSGSARSGSTVKSIPSVYMKTKVLGDTDYVDIKMRVASRI